MSWINAGWLLLDLIIIVILIPIVILQRWELGATLAWILVIVLIPFPGLLAFWVFGTTRLRLRRRKRGYNSDSAGYLPTPTARRRHWQGAGALVIAHCSTSVTDSS